MEWSVFNRIRISMRSRPGSELQYQTVAGIAIEGIEDLTDIADVV